jgi:hypothetical protein
LDVLGARVHGIRRKRRRIPLQARLVSAPFLS